ncbi:MAG: protein-L-isoaspartate(D-aspartate) O-methyltransferase [Anaerolineae bacterium]|nr:MAG: protein-L-isoaspartate(D-aspartate) O-methyltransferase [Anaerolineae bacterium]
MTAKTLIKLVLTLVLLAACRPTLALPTLEPATATPAASPVTEPTPTRGEAKAESPETATVETPLATPSPEASPTPKPQATEAVPHTVCTDQPPFARARASMVQATILDRGVSDERVLAVMQSVLRHCFVREEDLGFAYADHPLPIGYGQTISQPYIVALMTELLGLESDDKVLEVGTGSGYQAAVLSGLVAEVYTVEIVEPLATSAAERLAALGYDNVTVKHADGYYGWEEHAPFDAIIVTAAPDHVPPPLVKQLKDGGQLVIPVGPQGGFQVLWQITRQGEQVQAKEITGVRFVPLTGQH